MPLPAHQGSKCVSGFTTLKALNLWLCWGRWQGFWRGFVLDIAQLEALACRASRAAGVGSWGRGTTALYWFPSPSLTAAQSDLAHNPTTQSPPPAPTPPATFSAYLPLGGQEHHVFKIHPGYHICRPPGTHSTDIEVFMLPSCPDGNQTLRDTSVNRIL